MRKPLVLAMIFVTVIGLLLLGCTNKNELYSLEPATKPVISTLPSWVTQPSHDKGITATACVLSLDDFGVDMERASLEATGELASMINTQIHSTQVSKSRSKNVSTELVTSSSFESVVHSLVNAHLIGVYGIQSSYLTINGVKHFCSQVAMDSKALNKLMDELEKSNKNQYIDIIGQLAGFEE